MFFAKSFGTRSHSPSGTSRAMAAKVWSRKGAGATGHNTATGRASCSMTTSSPVRTRSSSAAKSRAASVAEMWITRFPIFELYTEQPVAPREYASARRTFSSGSRFPCKLRSLDVSSPCHFSLPGCKDSKAGVVGAGGVGNGQLISGIDHPGTRRPQKISPQLPDFALFYLTIRQFYATRIADRGRQWKNGRGRSPRPESRAPKSEPEQADALAR